MSSDSELWRELALFDVSHDDYSKSEAEDDKTHLQRLTEDFDAFMDKDFDAFMDKDSDAFMDMDFSEYFSDEYRAYTDLPGLLPYPLNIEQLRSTHVVSGHVADWDQKTFVTANTTLTRKTFLSAVSGDNEPDQHNVLALQAYVLDCYNRRGSQDY
jgi:HSP20 family molecular chaperone IbpA